MNSCVFPLCTCNEKWITVFGMLCHSSFTWVHLYQSFEGRHLKKFPPSLSVGALQWRHDPHGRFQYEEGHERKCHYKGISRLSTLCREMMSAVSSLTFHWCVDLGYRRAAEVPEHVGALLSGRQCHCVSIPNAEKVALHLTKLTLFFGCCFFFLLDFSYMVDAADQEKVEASRNELHNLLDKPQLQGIPVSVAARRRFLITAASNLNSVSISGFGAWQQEGSSHCFRWKATHWENVSGAKCLLHYFKMYRLTGNLWI